MDIAFSASIFFYFDFRISGYEDSVLKILVLKLFCKFPIYAFITPPFDVLRVWILLMMLDPPTCKGISMVRNPN